MHALIQAEADCRLQLTNDVAHNKGGQVVQEIAVLFAQGLQKMTWG